MEVSLDCAVWRNRHWSIQLLHHQLQALLSLQDFLLHTVAPWSRTEEDGPGVVDVSGGAYPVSAIDVDHEILIEGVFMEVEDQENAMQQYLLNSLPAQEEEDVFGFPACGLDD